MTRYHTLPEVAEMTRMSVPCLRREIRAGRLRCTRLTPGVTARILITDRDLEEWLARGAARQLAPRR